MSAYTKPQQIDVRKFIRVINNGLNTQLNEAAEAVRKAGDKVNRNWELVALNGTELLFEDATSDQFILAKYVAKPHPQISDITPVEIIDEGKQDEFAEACKLLVESVEAEDKKAVNSAFNRMSLHRFSSHVIPASQRIRCRDGNVYQLPVNENRIFNSDEIGQIINEAKTHYTSGVVIKEGKIVAYNGSGSSLKIDPIVPFTARARQLRQVAFKGHENTKFRNAVLESASLLAEGKTEDSAKRIGRALQIDEEFTLLRESDMITVVENCLATQAIFNDKLAQDVGVMAHQLNLKVNKKKIVQEWRKTAKKAGSTVLLENVHRLENSTNFPGAHSKFIAILFEDAGGRDTKILMLRTTLEKMTNDIPGIAKDPNLNEKMQSLIGRLKGEQVDEATMFEAEDVVAAVGDELQDTETLDDFDNIGGGETDDFDLDGLDDGGDGLDDAAGDAVATDVEGEGGGTTITINSPLIQIGGESGGEGGAEEDLEGAMGDDALGMDTDIETDELDVDLADTDESPVGDGGGASDPLAVGGAEEEEDDFDFGGLDGEEDEEEEDNPFGESVQSPVHYEMKQGSEDDMPATSYPKKISESVSTYGQKILKEGGLVDDVIGTMHSLMNAGTTNITEAAEGALSILKITYPKASTWQVVQEAVAAYESADMEEVSEDDDSFELQSGKNPKQASIRNLGEGEDEDEDDEAVEEEQLRGPNTNPLGINNSDNKDPVVEWANVGDGVSHGICENTKFILGHSNLNNMELRSNDGSITVPVPNPLCESALGSLQLSDTDPKQFNTWVAQIVESMSPLSELEDDDLDDAIGQAGGMGEMGGMDDDAEDDDMLSVYDDPDSGSDYGMDEMFSLKMVNQETGEEMNVAPQEDGTMVPTGEAPDEEPEFPGDDDDAGNEPPEFDSDDDSDGDGGDDNSEPPTPPSSDEESDDGDGEDSDEDDDSDDEEESEEGSEEGDDKPAFLKEAEDKDGNGRPDFIDKKIKADKKGKDTQDKDGNGRPDFVDQKIKGEDETIEEGPYNQTNEQHDATIGLYWYENQWFIGDGPVNTDVPAPAVLQEVAKRLGLTDGVSSGQMDPDQLIFNVHLDTEFSGESYGGDYDSPMSSSPEAPFDDRSVTVTGAEVELDLPDGTKKRVPLGPEVAHALSDELGEQLGGSY